MTGRAAASFINWTDGWSAMISSDVYRERWESFLANAGSIQCFGTNDRFTAEYLSALCGGTSIEQVSFEAARERGHVHGDSDYRTATDSLIGRRLMISRSCVKSCTTITNCMP